MAIAQQPLSTKKQALQDSLVIAFGGFSTKGKKANNEDAFALKMSKGLELERKGHIAVIADGVSSANCAEKASQMSVCHFINEFLATPDTWSVQKSAAKVISSLNNWFYSRQLVTDEKGAVEQWFSTFSALILKGDKAQIFHIGDCQIAKINNDGYQVLTKEHATVSGTLNRALGAGTHIEVDYSSTILAPQDILILSCDGVYQFVKQKQIKQIIKQTLEQNKNLEQVSKDIVELALKQGSNDNLTCLLVRIDQLPKQAFSQLVFTRLQQVVPPALRVGSLLDHYEILDTLQQTTRSHVYLAKDTQLEKLVVIKVPSVNFCDDHDYLTGFIKEGWIGNKIDHPAIMKIYPRIEQGRFLYHACEYIEGQTLYGWLKDNPNPSLIKIRDILEQLVKILRVLQRQDILHCDIKPDNFIIDTHGRIKLLDFGSGYVGSDEQNQPIGNQGTLNYSAPELFYLHKNSHQSELYALAVIIYQLLTNHLPYKEIYQIDSAPKQYDLWRYKPVTTYRKDLPSYIDMVLSKALAPNPNNRYEHYSEFQTAFIANNQNNINALQNIPLLERDPVKFWKGLSATLFLALLSALFFC